jgi:hypothetical protein
MNNFQEVINCINIPSSQLLDPNEQQWLFRKLIWEEFYLVGYNTVQSSENQSAIQRNTSPPLSADIHQMTQCYNLEERTLHSHHCENLKFNNTHHCENHNYVSMILYGTEF